MDFKYNIENAYPNTVSLHDCRITKIYTEGEDLIIEFGIDGFWVIAGSEYNNSDKTLRTGQSSVRFTKAGEYSEYSVIIYLYKKYSFFRRPFLTTRKEIPLEKLQNKVNSEKCIIEIVDERYSVENVLIRAYIATDRGKRTECQIEICFKKMIYSWNELCKDREW